MIYLDNAATTLHKPPEVGQAMLDALQTAGNPGRGAHAPTLHASRIVYETREALARLFHAEGPACIAFASNATQALNTAINGLFGPGDHVITTVCEHNSVLRPLYRLQRQGVEVSFVDVDANGVLCYAQFEQLLRPNTRGVVVTGASNVTGNRTDLAFVSAFAKKHGLLFLVDAAQTAGAMPVDVQALGIDVLCFTGHKALLGPQGTGGLYVRPGLQVAPFVVGGSGVHSFDERHPDEMPTALEAGTLNVPGIAGLGLAAKKMYEDHLAKVSQMYECKAHLIQKLEEIDKVTVHAVTPELRECAPHVVSASFEGVGSEVLLHALEDRGIYVSSGSACSSNHPGISSTLQAIGVPDKLLESTIRFSFSVYTTIEELDYTVEQLKELLPVLRRYVRR